MICKRVIQKIVHHATTIQLVQIAGLVCPFLAIMSAAIAIAVTMTTATAPTLIRHTHAKKVPVTKTSAPIRQVLGVIVEPFSNRFLSGMLFYLLTKVNNDIYVWSTYAYLPFLLFLGPYAELFSYRTAILVGISGRVVTRFLLLYGSSVSDMQLMQVGWYFLSLPNR